MNKLSYEEKVNEYLDTITKLNRNIRPNDPYFFSDYTPMYDWFLSEMTAVRKLLKNSDKISDSRKEKYEKFKTILIKLDEYTIDKRMKVKNRANYYLEIVKKINRRINSKDKFTFEKPDNSNMYKWFLAKLQKIELKRKNNIIPDEDELKEIETIAYIYNEYYNFDIEDYKKRVDEYIEVIDKIGGLPRYNCYHKFSDDADMALWFAHQNSLFKEEREKEKVLNHKRMTEAMYFAKIYDHLYDMNHRKK